MFKNILLKVTFFWFLTFIIVGVKIGQGIFTIDLFRMTETRCNIFYHYSKMICWLVIRTSHSFKNKWPKNKTFSCYIFTVYLVDCLQLQNFTSNCLIDMIYPLNDLCILNIWLTYEHSIYLNNRHNLQIIKRLFCIFFAQNWHILGLFVYTLFLL